MYQKRYLWGIRLFANGFQLKQICVHKDMSIELNETIRLIIIWEQSLDWINSEENFITIFSKLKKHARAIMKEHVAT